MATPVHQRKETPPVPTVLYLCNGEDTHCSKTNCVYAGGDCKHTSNIEYAVNFKKYTPTDSGDGKVSYFENENCFVGNITPETDAAQPVIIGVDLAKGADHTAPDLMDKTREQFKAYGDDVKAVCAASDEVQAFGFRACPRNIYADDIAKSVCVCGGGKPCRKRFATCWKLYFKAKGGGK